MVMGAMAGVTPADIVAALGHVDEFVVAEIIGTLREAELEEPVRDR
jgi:hypothetical protein